MKLRIQIFFGSFFSLVEGSVKLWIQKVFGAIFCCHFRFCFVGLVCTWVEVKNDKQSSMLFVNGGLFTCRVGGFDGF